VAVVQYTFKETNFLAYENKIISSCIFTEMFFYLVKLSSSNNPFTLIQCFTSALLCMLLFSNIPTSITSHLKFIITCSLLVKMDKSNPFGSSYSSQYSCIHIITINTYKLYFQKNYI